MSAGQSDVDLHCVEIAINSYIKDPTDEGTCLDGYESQGTGNWDAIPRKSGDLCSRGNFCVGGVRNVCTPGSYCNARFTSAVAG
jgi:hypothetical protein